MRLFAGLLMASHDRRNGTKSLPYCFFENALAKVFFLFCCSMVAVFLEEGTKCQGFVVMPQ